MPDAVRATLVAHRLDAHLAERFPVGRRLRVLDVGAAPGPHHLLPEPIPGEQPLRLAGLGHEVTVLAPEGPGLSAVRARVVTKPAGVRSRVRLLAGAPGETGVHFQPRTFDVVLCHGALSHTDEPGPLLAGLARVLAIGGLLSLVVRNADALALRPGLAGDWEAALAAFDHPIVAGEDGRLARTHRRAALTATLAGIGAPLHAWYGVGVFAGGPAAPSPGPDAGAGPGPEEGELAAEERAGRTDPYRDVAELLHLFGVRG
ncbi:methyltransferase domain-containing protein [Streptomyces sp. TRM 70351]|uniref:class I SAM-dependent methyltransferase n=1 Tax=Streptomyces sp. TRM 70351 TaxID=3116552 RepID=UPI002E7ACB2C|nr:methyltransferase domain-containing protein [Streptomyces sp. TRM 70351]MEE1928672.1 methyltransferase domain-containing protein [Streptomyces sp. TRM 70351]